MDNIIRKIGDGKVETKVRNAERDFFLKDARKKGQVQKVGKESPTYKQVLKEEIQSKGREQILKTEPPPRDMREDLTLHLGEVRHTPGKTSPEQSTCSNKIIGL